MFSRRILLSVLFGLLAIAAPVASGWLVNYSEPVLQRAQWPTPPPECGLYDTCNLGS